MQPEQRRARCTKGEDDGRDDGDQRKLGRDGLVECVQSAELREEGCRGRGGVEERWEGKVGGGEDGACGDREISECGPTERRIGGRAPDVRAANMGARICNTEVKADILEH